MGMPSLKRVTITTAQKLENWLSKHSGPEVSVMLVTHGVASNPKHINREQIADSVSKHGWNAGFSYTLKGGLLGHVISRQGD